MAPPSKESMASGPTDWGLSGLSVEPLGSEEFVGEFWDPPNWGEQSFCVVFPSGVVVTVLQETVWFRVEF